MTFGWSRCIAPDGASHGAGGRGASGAVQRRLLVRHLPFLVRVFGWLLWGHDRCSLP